MSGLCVSRSATSHLATVSAPLKQRERYTDCSQGKNKSQLLDVRGKYLVTACQKRAGLEVWSSDAAFHEH